MPFDYEDYNLKGSTLPPEALRAEWESYARQIAGGARSAAGSVAIAPFAVGASQVGLGLSTPQIHNARKEREVVGTHLHVHVTAHHTSKQGVPAPTAIAGSVTGLTLGLGAGPIASRVVGKRVEHVVSHVTLQTADGMLEHKRDEHEKAMDQPQLAKNYGIGANMGGPQLRPARSQWLQVQSERQYPVQSNPPPYSVLGSGQQATYNAPQARAQQLPLKHQTIQKSRSANDLHSLMHGYLPSQSQITVKTQQTYPQQAPQEYIVNKPPSLDPKPFLTQPSKPTNETQAMEGENKNPEKGAKSGMSLPYFGLPDHDEAEQRGLKWDATRGMYVKPESSNSQSTERPLRVAMSQADPKPPQSQSDEAEQRGLKWDATRGMYVKPESMNSQPTEVLLPANSPQADPKPSQGQSGELEDLMSRLPKEDSVPSEQLTSARPVIEDTCQVSMPPAASSFTQAEHSGHLSQYYPPPPPPPYISFEKSSHPSSIGNEGVQNDVLVPLPLAITQVTSPALPPRPKAPALPPRPKSSIGNYSTPIREPEHPNRFSYLPPPPPQTRNPQQADDFTPAPQISLNPSHAPVTVQPQGCYNPLQYSPLPSPARPSYQPAQYSEYRPKGHQPPLPPRRPSPQPLQQPPHARSHEQRQDSISSTISSLSSTSQFSLASATTVSPLSTPLTSYSTMVSPVPSNDSPRLGGVINPSLHSPQPPAVGMYFPPPPLPNLERGRKSYFG